MGHAVRKASMSADDYVRWEAQQDTRHDFVHGEVFAMAGAEDRHVTVCLNLAVALRQQLAGGRCRTFVSDMKVEAAPGEAYFYPDVLVTCSESDRQSAYIKRDPILIVEVLSPSTAGYDLGEKFTQYRRIGSLLEVAFVNLDARRADVYRKGADGLWVLHPCDEGDALSLASVDLRLGAAELFADIDSEDRASGTV